MYFFIRVLPLHRPSLAHLPEILKCLAGPDIAASIHLMEIGGLSPVNEFHKRTKDAFDAALNSIDGRLLDAFDGLEITAERLDFSAMGLHGPASTWTYLVDDHSMSNPLLRAMRRFGLG